MDKFAMAAFTSVNASESRLLQFRHQLTNLARHTLKLVRREMAMPASIKLAFHEFPHSRTIALPKSPRIKFERQPHRTKPEPVNQKITGQQECFPAAARLPRRSQAKVGARRRDKFRYS